MNLFKQLTAPVAAGVVFHLTVRASGDKMQLEVIPVCDSGKTGISLTPRAFVGSPEELDAEFPGFLETYVTSTNNLTEQIAVSKTVMEAAELAAKEAVKNASAFKADAKSAGTSKSVGGTAAAPKRDMNAGMATDLDDDDIPPADELPHTGPITGGEDLAAKNPSLPNLFI